MSDFFVVAFQSELLVCEKVTLVIAKNTTVSNLYFIIYLNLVKIEPKNKIYFEISSLYLLKVLLK
jgi:hypothetical protein